jgi:hypothetical protein
MGDKFLVVDADQEIYYFDEPNLYHFLNEVGVEEDEKVGYDVLHSFPLPEPDDMTDDDDTDDDAAAEEEEVDYGLEEYDGDNRPYGDYCPFGATLWPSSKVFILNLTTKRVFVPQKKKVTKTVEAFEYVPPLPPQPRNRTPAKKATTRAR